MEALEIPEPNIPFIKIEPCIEEARLKKLGDHNETAGIKLLESNKEEEIIDDADDDKLPECPHCSVKSKTQRALTEHIKFAHPTSELPVHECPHCNFSTVRKCNLLRHVRIRHTEPDKLKMHRCTECDYKAKLSTMLKNHIKFVHNKHNQQPHKCTQCDYISVRRDAFMRHIKLKHTTPTEEELIHCEHCDYKSRHRHRLKEHMMHRHPNDNCRWLQCKLCDYKSVSQSNLQSHIKFKHTDLRLFQCTECDYKAKTKPRLSLHSKHVHRHGLTDFFKCEQCSYTTAWKDNIRRHVRVVHTKLTEDDLFECSFCEYKSKTRSSLTDHEKFKHMRALMATLSCEQCDYKSIRKIDMRRHMANKHMVVQDEELLRCEICSKTFKTKVNLDKHVRCMHSGPVGTNKCEHCDYTTARRDDLVKHMRNLHPELVPPRDWKCKMCGHDAMDKKDLNGHIVQMHSAKYWKKGPPNNLTELANAMGDGNSPTPSESHADSPAPVDNTEDCSRSRNSIEQTDSKSVINSIINKIKVEKEDNPCEEDKPQYLEIQKIAGDSSFGYVSVNDVQRTKVKEEVIKAEDVEPKVEGCN